MSNEPANRPSLIARLLRRQPPPPLPPATPDHIATFLAALQQMASRMKEDLPLPELVGDLAEQSAAAIETEVALVRLLDRDGHGLVVQGVHGVAAHRMAGLMGSYSVITDVFRSLWPGSLAAFDLRAGLPPVLTPAEFTELQELGVVHLLVLPLHYRGRLVGRLDLGRHWDDPFSVDDRAAGTVLAGMLASAVAAPTSGSEQAAAEILEASFTFQQSIAPLLSVGETLQSIVDSARQITGADRCLGLLWQEPRRQFTPIAASGYEPRLLDTIKATVYSPATIPALAQAIHSDEPVVIADAHASPLLPAEIQQVHGSSAALVVALRGREERVLGALILEMIRPAFQFSEQAIAVAGNIAAHASVVVENATLYEHVKRSSDDLTLVNEIGIDLASLSDLSSLFGQLYHHITSVIDAPRFCVGLLLPDAASLEYRYAVDGTLEGTPVALPLGEDPLSYVARASKRVMVNARHARDTTNWFTPLPGLTPSASMLAVPLIVGHRTIGVMSAQTDRPGAYTSHQLELLATIGMQTGVAIENARLYAMVQQRGELRGYLLDKMISRQEAERKTLVDDIHNDTLQTLASCLYRIELSGRQVREMHPDQAQRTLQEVRDSLAENIARLRERIFQIRPSTLDILGLRPALAEYFSQLERETGIKAALDVELPDRLPNELETAVYRIVQEAIDHVRVRDGATRVAIRIRERQGNIVVTIADDGQGMDPAVLQTVPSHATYADARVRLLTLKERAELAGGELRMANRSNGGATIQILLPLRSA